MFPPQFSINVPVPPLNVSIAVPLSPPLQLTFVVDNVAIIRLGSVIVADPDFTH